MAPPKAAPFPVAPMTSPFPDKYDIEGERAALRDLVEAPELDTNDPRYARYVELERREELLERMRTEHRLRDGAEQDVPYREAQQVRTGLGKLVDEEDDSMFLHTREASRLFLGRAVEPGRVGRPQAGGKKVGAALRAIWYLSGNDNPYADFAMIEAGSRISGLVQELNKMTDEAENRLVQLRNRGLVFSVLKADPPVQVALGFRSPYGYSVVNLISTFDYHTRVIKTLVRKDLMSDRDGYAALYTQTRRCRSIFERVIWFQRYLLREELRPLSRADFLPSADEEARKRVQAAVALFGELPREVFNGQIAPRHSRRRLDLSAEELRLLESVPLAGDPVVEAATEALV